MTDLQGKIVRPNAAAGGRAPKADSGPTLFHLLRERLVDLIPVFGLSADKDRLLEAYDLLGASSLAFDARHKPPAFSRINADGTPIQLSLSMARATSSPLQFIVETGAPTFSSLERMAYSLHKLSKLARLFDASQELEECIGLLSLLAPERNPALHLDGSGVFWIGVSFAASCPPALTIYVNTKWGSISERHARITAFASWFGVSAQWKSRADRLWSQMEPLGTALTLAHGQPIRGRVYASAYGLPLQSFENADVHRFCRAFLRDDVAFPLRSCVTSLEFRRPDQIVGQKFELCAHCAVATEAEVAARLTGWFRRNQTDDYMYREAVDVLTGGRSLSNTQSPALHSMVGVAIRQGLAYTSVYLNPGPCFREK